VWEKRLMTENPRNNSLDKYETAVILKGGSTLYLRPIRQDDEERLLAFFYRMSPHTIYLTKVSPGLDPSA
jgi:hypothetical protein